MWRRLEMQRKKLKSLSICRFIAMILVMYGHLIEVGQYAVEIPGVIDGVMPHTIIDPVNFKLQGIGSFLFSCLKTQSAIVGVVVFFILTGYLITFTLEKYNRIEFIVNRFFRIYPTLFIATLLWGGIAFVSQGLTFSPLQYFSQITLLYQVLNVDCFMGVLWTLTIEVFFYAIAALWKRFDEYSIAATYIIIILSGIFYYEFPNRHTYNMFYDLRYFGFILLGCSIALCQSQKRIHFSFRRKVVMIGLPFCLNLIIFQAARGLFGDETTYPNFFSHLIPLILVLGLLCLEKYYPALFDRIPKVFYGISDLTYPVYLSHVCIGLTCMYHLSQMGVNRYLTVISGFIMALIVGKILAMLIERPAIALHRRIIAVMQKIPEGH